ncbi:glutathione S-transferase-like [Arctopsyche grandis]|uniref:glutathione S-transferase-like n=1 Tax=Arctopsyche grandis TaxID=121162 RepID=UPI00406D9071
MAQYKLTYFNVKGVSEPIRYLFAYAGVEFEDERVEKDAWPKMKADKPFGQLPVLDTGDAFVLTQSVAIARYLGKKFNLSGKDDLHNAQLDALVDHMADLQSKLSKALLGSQTPAEIFARGSIPPPDTTEIAKFENELLPIFLQKFNAIAAEGFFYGSQATWADVYFAGWIDTLETRLKNEILGSYPNLTHIKRIIQETNTVQNYLEKRPFTTM